MPSQTFDEVLALEEEFYDDGFKQGLADGIVAGRVEGRTFGLEKGFEKFVETGKLHGKSLIWANRISQSQKSDKIKTEDSKPLQEPLSLDRLPANPRLQKHIITLHALVESETLSTENTEEAVSDFDDRLKRAQAKIKVVERLIGVEKGNVGGG